MRVRSLLVGLAWFAVSCVATAAPVERYVEIPTRPGVTQAFVYVAPEAPKAAAVLIAGGDGWLQIYPNGSFKREGNFLVRSRRLFADAGIAVAVIDVPSDRQSAPFLNGFRQTAEHVTDLAAVMAWLRAQTKLPVWLIGTSRGTQSAAYAATQLKRDAGGPDGIVLTSTILSDARSRAVPRMDLDRIAVPVLVVHHEHDGCKLCAPSLLPDLMDKLGAAPRKELVMFDGGDDVGDPCEARAHHGFNAIEPKVVERIAQWMTAP